MDVDAMTMEELLAKREQLVTQIEDLLRQICNPED